MRLNEHLEHPEGVVVFQHACKLGCEGIVSKRLGSRYRSGRSPDWLKFKNPEAPAVRREAEEDWGEGRADEAAGRTFRNSRGREAELLSRRQNRCNCRLRNFSRPETQTAKLL